MTRQQNRAALIVSPDNALLGIVTDQDLRSRVLAASVNPDSSISAVMTPNPVILSSDQTTSEALQLMARLNLRYLTVKDKNGPPGLVSVFDLLRHYQYNAAYLLSDIHAANDAAALSQLSHHIPTTMQHMVHNGLPPTEVCEAISLVGQEIVHRLLKLAEKTLGPAPVPFAFIVAGSMGRHEQTALTDQDHALILSDEFIREEHDSYFLQMAQFVSDGMDKCGYEYCPGNIMATNEKWRQPLKNWRQVFRDWIETPQPQALLHSEIFFDMRFVYGDELLYTSLHQELLQRTQKSFLFQRLMAANARNFRPSLGLFKRLKWQRNSAGEKSINLKLYGLTPVISLARTHALALGIAELNTHQRINAVTELKRLSSSDSRNLIDAFDLVSRIRLQHQADQIRQKVTTDNELRPSELSALERRHLRDAFSVISSLQDSMIRHYTAN